MALLSKDDAQTILKKVLSYSKADECSVSLTTNQGGNIRYARSAVSTAGEVTNMNLVVSSTFGKQTGTTTINEFDDASLQKVVARAEELAKLAPENPEYMPQLGPQTFADSIAFSSKTAGMTPESRAEMVAQSLKVAKEADLEAAGFLVNNSGISAMMNSRGLFAYSPASSVDFSVTFRNREGTGSGYVSHQFNDVSKLDTLTLSKIAATKASTSAGAKAIEPGKYTVILEPLAASDMLNGLIRGFDARSADEGRSFMTKKGGGTRLGEQLVSEKVNIYTDPLNPDLPGDTWTGDGLPVKRTSWIEKGVVKNLAYSRYWAAQKGVEPLPGSRTFIMEGGNGTTEDLIKGTEKGILVTRFWYIRMVDQQTMLLTGLTRDGTFYIENGQIKFPVKNFRFNESPIIMLNNVDELGKAVRSGSCILPPMRIRDFTFTSLSDAI